MLGTSFARCGGEPPQLVFAVGDGAERPRRFRRQTVVVAVHLGLVDEVLLALGGESVKPGGAARERVVVLVAQTPRLAPERSSRAPNRRRSASELSRLRVESGSDPRSKARAPDPDRA